MPIIEGTKRAKSVEAAYDFAVDGGAVGQLTLRGDNTVPAGSVVTHGYIDTETASGGTGTISVDLEAAGDIRAAATLAAGRSNVVPAATGATSVKTTTSRSIKITIGTAALTAGKFRVVLFYR